MRNVAKLSLFYGLRSNNCSDIQESLSADSKLFNCIHSLNIALITLSKLCTSSKLVSKQIIYCSQLVDTFKTILGFRIQFAGF